MGLEGVQFAYTGGARGWTGDVPVVRFSSDKLAALGWRCRYTSIDALTDSIEANMAEARQELYK